MHPQKGMHNLLHTLTGVEREDMPLLKKYKKIPSSFTFCLHPRTEVVHNRTSGAIFVHMRHNSGSKDIVKSDRQNTQCKIPIRI